MKDLPDLVADIVDATRKHEQYRDKECINMIASEGLKSPAVNQMLDDLEERHGQPEMRNVIHVGAAVLFATPRVYAPRGCTGSPGAPTTATTRRPSPASRWPRSRRKTLFPRG